MTHDQAFMAVFGDLVRQAPGSVASTRRALDLARPLLPAGVVLDVGCGTGASSRVLARHLDRPVAASDLLASSLAIARRRAALAGVGDRVAYAVASLDRPPVAPGTAALIWCEGAAYAVGVDRALAAWRDLLAPGGVVVFSDLVWLDAARPAAAAAFFATEYPAMADRAALRRLVDAARFEWVADFVLPPEDWWESYYLPLAARLDAIEPAADPALAEVAAATRQEIATCRDHGETYGYVMTIARKAA